MVKSAPLGLLEFHHAQALPLTLKLLLWGLHEEKSRRLCGDCILEDFSLCVLLFLINYFWLDHEWDTCNFSNSIHCAIMCFEFWILMGIWCWIYDGILALRCYKYEYCHLFVIWNVLNLLDVPWEYHEIGMIYCSLIRCIIVYVSYVENLENVGYVYVSYGYGYTFVLLWLVRWEPLFLRFGVVSVIMEGVYIG